jgi:hypothetical protein
MTLPFSEYAEPTPRRSALRWLVLAIVLVLHWAAPQSGQPDTGFSRPIDGTSPLSIEEQGSRPTALPLSQPRSNRLEATPHDTALSGLPSGDDPDGPILRHGGQRLAVSRSARATSVCIPARPAFTRLFDPRAPPPLTA